MSTAPTPDLTPEEIEWVKNKARDHVAYGWVPSPGSHTRDWDERHSALYRAEYARFKAEHGYDAFGRSATDRAASAARENGGAA